MTPGEDKNFRKGTTDAALRWLLAVFILAIISLVAVRLIFTSLHNEIESQSDNERARIFIGEEIDHGLHSLEKALYQASGATGPAGLKRVRQVFEVQLTKLRGDLETLRTGGTVRRSLSLNLQEIDETSREVTYRVAGGEAGQFLEQIEILPLLDQMPGRMDELERLLNRLWHAQERAQPKDFLKVHDEIDLFLKRVPPFFERIQENSHRLFYEGHVRLSKLEATLAAQSFRLRIAEYVLFALVIVLTSVAGWVFSRRIRVGNQRLTVALDEMRLAKAEAEKASQAKSEFVSRMSHELRTPLNAIIGFGELMEAEQLNATQRNYIGLINRSGRHLLELINAVLDHAKIEAGEMTIEQLPLDLQALLEDVRTIVNERAAEKGLELNVAFEPGVPQWILGDPMRLRQVLINLMNNAVKFTLQGGITVSARQDERFLAFSVRDTGVGMDEAGLARLFKPFSQADASVARRFGGTGLGLTISKELIEAMGGDIRVESVPQKGSTFIFRIPLHEVSRPEGHAATVSAPEVQDALPALVGGRILLVEDNKINQTLATALLSRMGMQFEVASDGQEALDQTAQQRFALVLMDMEMPVMDGVTATLRLRERGEQVPIIAMTANALAEDRQRCFDAGMNGFVAKPIRVADLRLEIERVMKMFAARAAPAPIGPHQSDAAIADAAIETNIAPAETPPPQEALPVMDRALAMARMGDDEELLASLAEVFIEQLPETLAEMDRAAKDRDLASLARAAHTMKGLFDTFACAAGKTVAAELEHGASSLSDGEIDALRAAIALWGQRLADALRA